MLQTDHYPYPEVRRSYLVLQTALLVLLIGVGIGIFSDGLGFTGASMFASNGSEFSGFKTVNISYVKR